MFYLNFWHKYNYNDHIMNTMRFLHEVVGYSRVHFGFEPVSEIFYDHYGKIPCSRCAVLMFMKSQWSHHNII